MSEDSLDAYMASLHLPEDQSQSMAQARSEHNASRSSVQSERSVVVKNRRYRRLQQLLDDSEEGQYFSDSMMQQRSPALFHFYLGQYLGLDKSANSLEDNGEQTLSSFLMDTCQRKEMEIRRTAEQDTWSKFTAVDEKQERDRLDKLYEEDSTQEEEEEEESEEEDMAEFSIQERRQLLIEIMSSRFLDGKDNEYVNYAEVDADERLDDLDAIQRDAEDRYFEGG
ncbi:Coiled-coil domain-containing protein 97 [Phytophthora citrophthora]|uniref:Coiled-coil domain-containing protein 97 n=1 Tax=Phytophthora citrophthora TaxID=4793 RepID=A0AAD9G1X8_9STRA|nr:Coiled-coil domain-containing protein 97 [Phytophthora citrophthora]